MPRGPDRPSNDRYLSRREWLGSLGIAGAGTLAGCPGGLSDDDGGTDADGGVTIAGDGSGDGFGSTEGGLEAAEELPAVSGTYDTVTSASFTTLNPLYNSEAGAGSAIGRVLDQGYTFDASQEFFPLLYDMSTDDGGEVWVFEVREGLEFGDPYGEVTAETFVYTVQELHQSDWANTVNATNWTGVTVEETGTYEFQAELENPQLLWPESFDPLMYPIPKGLVEPYAADEDAEGLRQDEELTELQFTGNLGAFVLEEWDRGAGTTYSRNDDYYIQDIEEGPRLFEGAPYFEGASIRVVEEQASRLGALRTGEADAAAIPPERFAEFDSEPNVEVLRSPQPFNEVVSLNMRDNGWTAGPGNLFRHVPFRQALASAIDKRSLIEGVFRGLAKPHHTWQPTWSPWYPEDADIPQFGVGDRYGPDVARDLAREAFGLSTHDYRFDGDSLVTPAGDQVTLDIYHSAGQDTERLIAEFVAEELGENLGLDVVVEAIDGVRFQSDYWQGPPEGGSATIGGETVTWEAPTPNNPGPRSVTSANAWDMSMVFGLNTFPRNPLTNDIFFDGPTAPFNPVGYYPEFDATALFERARSAGTESDLAAAFADLFVNLATEQPYLMLVFPDSLTGYNPRLQGPIENFSNGWNFPAWHFEDE